MTGHTGSLTPHAAPIRQRRQLMNHYERTRAQPALLRMALSLAARGWHIFPCAPGGKHPALHDSWKQLATIDPARIGRWWRSIPYNIGIACGPSDLVVVEP
jgi:hypothetical protein